MFWSIVKRQKRQPTWKKLKKFTKLPKPGEKWIHYKKGGVYVVLLTGSKWAGEEIPHLDTTSGSLITYRDVNTSVVWTQPLKRFLEEVQHGKPRFTKYSFNKRDE